MNKKNGQVNIKPLMIQMDLNRTLGALQNQCGPKIERLKAGESVIPPKRTIRPTSGPLPTPGKPRQQVPGQRETIAKTANLDEKKTLQNQSGYNDKKLINSFSKKEFEELSGKKISKLKGYKKLGELLDQYGNLLQQGHNRDEQGRTLLIDKLNEIVKLTEEYRDNVGTKDRKVAIAMGNYRRMAMEKIEGFQKENPDLYYVGRQAAKRLSGPLPMPGMKPVAQPMKQMQQQTKIAKPVGEEVKQEETKSVVDEVKQEEKTQNDIQQRNKEKEPEITGPSMRKDFLDVMRKSADGAGNEYYKKLIGKFEELYQLLGESITKANQEKSWKNLQKAYGELAAWSEGYAKAYTNAPTAISRVRRRQARMLMLMCSFDMRTLRIANSDPELAEKNTTWRQILEQPTGALAAQQNQSQQTEAKDAAQTNQPKGNPARDFRNLEQQLSNSEKGGLGRKNSKYFNRVMVALEQTAKAMEQGFGHVSSENIETLKAACAALQELLDACKQYTARNPRTKNGKARRSIVLLIQNYAEKDLRGCGSKLFEFYSMPADEQAKETWQSVIGGVRAMQLTVEDYSKLGSAEGGAASDTIKIELQEGDRAVTKYFKKEDSFNLEIIKEKGDDAPHYFAMQDTLQKYPNLSEKDKELLQELSRDASLEKKDFSEEGLLAAEYCKKRTAQVKTTIESLMISLGITEEGGMANMSRRNVATSRIAELLGLENLVAKSRTVDILDQATGQTTRGNLMDQAEGKEYGEVENAITENKIDSGFIRDLTNLQVLDILCGQVDRHRNNMLYKTDDQGTVIGVQGIDNDGAFGTNTDVASAKKSLS